MRAQSTATTHIPSLRRRQTAELLPTAIPLPRHPLSTQHRSNGFHHRPPSFHHLRPSPGDERGGPQGRVQEEPRDYGASNSHANHHPAGPRQRHSDTRIKRPGGDVQLRCCCIAQTELGLTGGSHANRFWVVSWSALWLAPVGTSVSQHHVIHTLGLGHTHTEHPSPFQTARRNPGLNTDRSISPPGRSPTKATSESTVPLTGMPWETGSTSGKYQYFPGGDSSAAPKDAPSAVNVVVVPNVELPQVRALLEHVISAWGVMPNPSFCRGSMTSTTSGARRATRRPIPVQEKIIEAAWELRCSEALGGGAASSCK